MKNLTKAIALFFLTTAVPAFACSYVQLGTPADLAGAQNFDFPPQVSAGIVVNKRHMEKSDGSFEGAPAAVPARWVSRYGSVTFGFGAENAVTGINEAGLRVYRFLFLEGRYPAPDARPALHENQYIQYLLDTAKDIDEVIEKTRNVQIYTARFPTHFTACDRTARCVVIEALNGKLGVFADSQRQAAALTNTDYLRSMELLEKCTSSACDQIKDESEWRFVQAATQVKKFSRGDTARGAFDILTSVKQSGTHVATLWTLLAHENRNESKFYVKNTASGRVVLELDLKQLDFSCKSPGQVALLHPDDAADAHLVNYTRGFQDTLGEVLVNYLGVSPADKAKRVDYPEQHTRCLE